MCLSYVWSSRVLFYAMLARSYCTAVPLVGVVRCSVSTRDPFVPMELLLLETAPSQDQLAPFIGFPSVHELPIRPAPRRECGGGGGGMFSVVQSVGFRQRNLFCSASVLNVFFLSG